MILVRRQPAVGKRRLILPPLGPDGRIDPLFKTKTYDHIKKYLLVIAHFGEGDCFGVGEDLTKMSIISGEKVGSPLADKQGAAICRFHNTWEGGAPLTQVFTALRLSDAGC